MWPQEIDISPVDNHIQHVKTQMPYAVTVGSVSVVLGTIPASFELIILLLSISLIN